MSCTIQVLEGDALRYARDRRAAGAVEGYHDRIAAYAAIRPTMVCNGVTAEVVRATERRSKYVAKVRYGYRLNGKRCSKADALAALGGVR